MLAALASAVLVVPTSADVTGRDNSIFIELQGGTADSAGYRVKNGTGCGVVAGSTANPWNDEFQGATQPATRQGRGSGDCLVRYETRFEAQPVVLGTAQADVSYRYSERSQVNTSPSGSGSMGTWS